jgi:hypothetical protein
MCSFVGEIEHCRIRDEKSELMYEKKRPSREAASYNIQISRDLERKKETSEMAKEK